MPPSFWRLYFLSPTLAVVTIPISLPLWQNYASKWDILKMAQAIIPVVAARRFLVPFIRYCKITWDLLNIADFLLLDHQSGWLCNKNAIFFGKTMLPVS